MRNAAAVLALFLVSPLAQAAAVTIGRPQIFYRPGASVQTFCNGRRACTTIKTEFGCGCRLDARGWVLEPHLIASPSIYSTSDVFLRHEMEHISDVRKSLNEYAAALLLRTFPSNESCRAFVDSETKTFSHTMKAIERGTIIRRDGVQFAGPPEPVQH